MSGSYGRSVFAAGVANPTTWGCMRTSPNGAQPPKDACSEAARRTYVYVATAETDASCIDYQETAQAAPRGANPSLFTPRIQRSTRQVQAVLACRLRAAASLWSRVLFFDRVRGLRSQCWQRSRCALSSQICTHPCRRPAGVLRTISHRNHDQRRTRIQQRRWRGKCTPCKRYGPSTGAGALAVNMFDLLQGRSVITCASLAAMPYMWSHRLPLCTAAGPACMVPTDCTHDSSV